MTDIAFKRYLLQLMCVLFAALEFVVDKLPRQVETVKRFTSSSSGPEA
jgi:hypothetical protein